MGAFLRAGYFFQSASTACAFTALSLCSSDSSSNVAPSTTFGTMSFLLPSDSTSRLHYFPGSTLGLQMGLLFYTLSPSCVTLSFLDFLILSFQLECNPLLEPHTQSHSHYPVVSAAIWFIAGWPLNFLSSCLCGCCAWSPSGFSLLGITRDYHLKPVCLQLIYLRPRR